MAGRRPKPEALKDIVGTIRPDRVRTEGKTPPPGEVIRPKYLRTKAEIALWEEFAPVCKVLGTLTTADPRTLANWCVKQAQFEKEKTKMKAADIAQLRQYAASLGLDATSKVRTGSLGKPPKNASDEFFEQTG